MALVSRQIKLSELIFSHGLYFETELLVMKCGSARECCQWFMVYLFSFAEVQTPSARGAHPSRKACKSRGIKVAARPLDSNLRKAVNLSRRHLKLLLKPSKRGRTNFTLRVKEQALLLTLQSMMIMMMMMMMMTSTDSNICERKENMVPCDYGLCCRVK